MVEQQRSPDQATEGFGERQDAGLVRFQATGPWHRGAWLSPEKPPGTHLTPSFSASCPVGRTTISNKEGIFLLYMSCCCCSCCGDSGSCTGMGS